MWLYLNLDIKISTISCLHTLFCRLNIEFIDAPILQKEFCELFANVVPPSLGIFIEQEAYQKYENIKHGYKISCMKRTEVYH